MRTLVYGMQSSGASLVTVFLGQAPRSVAVVDLWNSQLMPPLEVRDADHVIGKAVITTLYDFEDHARSFCPDRTILVLRDPAQNYVSLSRKFYSDESGGIDEKFALLEEVFNGRSRFDLTLLYEDFVLRPEETIEALAAIGAPSRLEHFTFPRATPELRDFAFDQSEWCRENYDKKWRFGNVQGGELRSSSLHKLVSPDVKRRVRALCPNVCAFYNEYFQLRGLTAFYRYRQAAWHDGIVPNWRRVVNRARRLRSTPAQTA